MLIGLPIFVMSGLFVSAVPGRVVEGAQPGGLIQGRVVDAEGRPLADIEVSLQLAQSDGGGAFSTSDESNLAPVTTGSDGRFEFAAPAHEGHYRVVTKADLWVGAGKSVTFVDREGNAYDPGELEITLEPGCSLRVEIVDASGAPAGSGAYRLSGEFTGGPFFGLLGGKSSMSGSIRGGVLELPGLRPMEATILIEMDNGNTATIGIPVEPGVVLRKLELGPRSVTLK